jgi:hypothetical protein
MDWKFGLRIIWILFYMASQPLVGKGLIFIEDSYSNSLSRMYTLSIEIHWTRDQPEAEASA